MCFPALALMLIQNDAMYRAMVVRVCLGAQRSPNPYLTLTASYVAWLQKTIQRPKYHYPLKSALASRTLTKSLSIIIP